METVACQSTKDFLEKALATYHERRFCVLTNRGTTALTTAFKGLGFEPGSGIVFPAAVCAVPVFSALFAGCCPLFSDVCLEDGNFNLADLDRVLFQAKGEARAVVAVHMFGKPDQLHALRDLCNHHQALLVEDCALALGSTQDGKPVGLQGDVAILSFVRKMVPLEMGGALLTDDPEVAKRARAFVESLPLDPPEGSVDAAMKAFHGLCGYVATTGWKRRDLLEPFETLFQSLMLRGTRESDWQGTIVLEELTKLPHVVQARRARAEVYQMVLNHPRIKHLDTKDSSLFAYPIRLEGAAAEFFLSFARSRGFLFKRIAYPEISSIFLPQQGDFPNARILEKELIGMPLDEGEPVSSFWDYAQDFLKSFENFVNSEPENNDPAGLLAMRMAGYE